MTVVDAFNFLDRGAVPSLSIDLVVIHHVQYQSITIPSFLQSVALFSHDPTQIKHTLALLFHCDAFLGDDCRDQLCRRDIKTRVVHPRESGRRDHHNGLCALAVRIDLWGVQCATRETCFERRTMLDGDAAEDML
jgi:hypothetical protein